MMRNMYMRFFAVLLAVWYLTSIIGFNVHICHASHHHSHSEAHHCECCHDESSESEVAFKCCTDDYLVLTVTGVVSENENDQNVSHMTDCQFVAGCVPGTDRLHPEFRINKIRALPEYGHLKTGDLQSVLGIWRI